MLRLLADENFNSDIVRGLLLRQPDLDIVRVQDENLAGMDDRDILAWAAENDRIVLTHDRATMPTHACNRVTTGQNTPGVFVFERSLPRRTSHPGDPADCRLHQASGMGGPGDLSATLSR